MPAKKSSKSLADLLIPRGQTTTDMTNRTNIVPRNAGSGLDAPLNRVPRNVSPDMHRYFQDYKLTQPRKKPRKGWKGTGDLA